MYHIKSDRRSQASAAEIVRGMQECLKTTPLKAVTVSDIHRVTGISRTTFYRLFDNPEDVLIYQLDQMLESAVSMYAQQEDSSAESILEQIIALGLQNYTFLKALMDNNRHDLLFRYTEKSFRQFDSVKKIFPEDMDPVERECIIVHLSMTMVACQITWDRSGQQETAKDLLRYLQRYAQVVTALLGEK